MRRRKETRRDEARKEADINTKITVEDLKSFKIVQVSCGKTFSVALSGISLHPSSLLFHSPPLLSSPLPFLSFIFVCIYLIFNRCWRCVHVGNRASTEAHEVFETRGGGRPQESQSN